MSIKYTPAPWRMEVCLVDGRSRYSISAGPNNPLVNSYRPVANVFDRSDAERIVACVNAMEGVANPAAVRDLIDAVGALMKAPGTDIRMPTAVGVALYKAFAAVEGSSK